MVRVTDLDASLRFYRDALGLDVLSVRDVLQGRFTLAFLAAPGNQSAQVELTYNWDPEDYTGGRNFGHLAYAVDDIYATCERLQSHGVTIVQHQTAKAQDGRKISGLTEINAEQKALLLALKITAPTPGGMQNPHL
jgi:lactoylglutathione lyase